MQVSRRRVMTLLAVAVASLAVSIVAGPRIAGMVEGATTWLRAAGVLGCGVFIAIEFLVTLVGIVPGALLGIAAGAVFGVVAGFWTGAVGILAGAVVAFGLSRSMLRPWIGRRLGERGKLAKVDSAITRDGWRLVALLRISPVMPFSITSYALGLSGVAARDYVIGTLASLPPLLGYVLIGALGGMGLSAQTRGIHLILLGFGVAATLALTVHLSRLLGAALREKKELLF